MQNKSKNAMSIKFQNADKVYDNGIKAIDRLNLNINPGQFYVLLGPSGCGKTTALRMIAGLESVSNGYIKFNDVVMNSTAPKDRNISMVFQNYALYPFMTVYNNIAFGIKNKARNNPEYNQLREKKKNARNSNYEKIQELKSHVSILTKGHTSDRDALMGLKRELRSAKIIKDVAEQKRILKEIEAIKNKFNKLKTSVNNQKEVAKLRAQIKQLQVTKKINREELKKILIQQKEIARKWQGAIPQKIEDISSMLGINMYLRRKPAELSGGQRQRVALARAVSKETSVFLYDEPLSNLDAKLRSKMRVEIRELHDKLGATSVYVTHDQVEAMSMADKIVVMNKGYVQQIGTPIELINKPYNLFVSKFIGNTDANILECTPASLTSFKVNGEKIEITNKPTLAKVDWAKHQSAFLMFRPEHAIVDPALVDNVRENVFMGKIVKKELLGSTVLVELDVKNLGAISVIVPTSHDVKVGENLKFAINPNKIQIFEREYGYNISEEFDEDNHKAREIWVSGLNERYKNDILLQAQKNQIKLSEWPSLLISSLFMNSSRERINKAKQKPVAIYEKIAK